MVAATAGYYGAADYAGADYYGQTWVGNRVYVTDAMTLDTVKAHINGNRNGVNAVPIIYSDDAGTPDVILMSGSAVTNFTTGENSLPLLS